MRLRANAWQLSNNWSSGLYLIIQINIDSWSKQQIFRTQIERWYLIKLCNRLLRRPREICSPRTLTVSTALLKRKDKLCDELFDNHLKLQSRFFASESTCVTYSLFCRLQISFAATTRSSTRRAPRMWALRLPRSRQSAPSCTASTASSRATWPRRACPPTTASTHTLKEKESSTTPEIGRTRTSERREMATFCDDWKS